MLKDIDFRFMVHPLTGDLVQKYENEAINQSLRSIVLTGRNERPLDPLFGVGIYDLLFESLDSMQIEAFVKRIKQAIFIYEPRIQIVNLSMIENKAENFLSINMLYTVITGGQPQKWNLTLERLK